MSLFDDLKKKKEIENMFPVLLQTINELLEEQKKTNKLLEKIVKNAK